MFKMHIRLLALLAFALCVSTVARADDIAFIVNKDTRISSLTAEDIKNILLGNKLKFDDGSNIKLAILAEGSVHEKTIHDYTQRSTDQFDKYWKKLVFSGKGIMPPQFKDDAELIDYVSKTPGGIGYVAKASATAAVSIIEIK